MSRGHLPDGWSQSEGLHLDPQTARSERPLTLVLAGAGVAPQVLAPALRGTGFERTRAVFVDYLAGEGPFDVVGMADALAAQLAPRRAGSFLVGHSLGGAVALLVAAHLESSLSGLVVSDTGLNAAGHKDPGLPERLRNDWTAEHRVSFKQSWTARPPDPGIDSALTTYLEAVDPHPLATSVESLRHVSLDEEAPKITAPTAVLHGVHDRRRSLDDARGITQAVPASSLFLFDCGHTPLIERPEEVRAVLNGLGWLPSPFAPSPRPESRGTDAAREP
ncbi:alpha/beta hydrolase [Brevibacterium salitolerans]|uniref:AB hydrolase-1 domain-containing protein n=1 Tax=Brevibacterium salitolerans TaxID=1403566 RepID=A0ABN2WKV0_9MICO